MYLVLKNWNTNSVTIWKCRKIFTKGTRHQDNVRKGEPTCYMTDPPVQFLFLSGSLSGPAWMTQDHVTNKMLGSWCFPIQEGTREIDTSCHLIFPWRTLTHLEIDLDPKIQGLIQSKTVKLIFIEGQAWDVLFYKKPGKIRGDKHTSAASSGFENRTSLCAGPTVILFLFVFYSLTVTSVNIDCLVLEVLGKDHQVRTQSCQLFQHVVVVAAVAAHCSHPLQCHVVYPGHLDHLASWGGVAPGCWPSRASVAAPGAVPAGHSTRSSAAILHSSPACNKMSGSCWQHERDCEEG